MPYKRFVSFADVFPFWREKKIIFKTSNKKSISPFIIILKLPDVNLIVADMFEFLGNMHGNWLQFSRSNTIELVPVDPVFFIWFLLYRIII